MSGPSGHNRDSRVLPWVALASVTVGSAFVGTSMLRGGKESGSNLSPEISVSVANVLRDAREASPFSAMQFREVAGSTPMVMVKVPGHEPDRWFRVVKIGDIPIDNLYDAAIRCDSNRPQRRLAEDLRRVFEQAGHALGDTTALLLEDIESGKEVALQDVPVTHRNRTQIRNARSEMDEGSQASAVLPAVPGALFQKLSPFNAIRWQGDEPEVRVEKDWFKLVSIDGVGTPEILAHCRSQYGNKWRERFAEDLVQVLTEMGHPPDSQVNLVLQPPGSTARVVRDGVQMTEDNRKAIRQDAKAEGSKPASRDRGNAGTRSAVPIDNAELFCARVDEFLQMARSRVGFSGAVIVARNGTPVYEGAFGGSDIDADPKNSVDTPFRIASLSKQFTAAAILHLEAQGKLSIEDPVHLYLDEFKAEPYRQITIHQLLTHSSGLPRIAEDASRWAAMSQVATPLEEFVKLACKQSLQFKPGADYQYSNFGYRVLSAVIEKVSGRDYAEYMEQEVFAPLGLKSAGVARTSRPAVENGVAQGLLYVNFNRESGQPLYVDGDRGRNYGTGYGSGGIYISAMDLVRWDRVLAGDSFLPQAQRDTLFTPVHDNYGCGWIVKKSGLDGRVYHTHDGASEGSFSKMMRIPADGLCIIAVGNVSTHPGMDDTLRDLFLLCRSLPYNDPPSSSKPDRK